jgi:cell division protein ZapA
MKKSYEVSILNQKFVIKSESDERYVQKVADYVNRKIHEIMTNTKSVSTLSVAILTALNVADDYFKLRGKSKEGSSGTVKKLKNIISLIDAQLG